MVPQTTQNMPCPPLTHLPLQAGSEVDGVGGPQTQEWVDRGDIYLQDLISGLGWEGG